MQVAQVAEDDALGAAVADLAVDGEGGLVVRPRLLHPALLVVQDAQVAEDDALGAAVADLAVDGEGGLEVRPRLLHPALLAVQDAQTAEDAALPAPVAQLAAERERLREPRSVPPSMRPARHEARAAGQECRGAQRSSDPVEGEHLRSQSDAQGERPLELQHLPGRAVGRDRRLPVAAPDGAAAGGDEVVELERERAAPPDAAVPAERLERLVGPEAREVPAVPLLGRPFRPGPARLAASPPRTRGC